MNLRKDHYCDPTIVRERWKMAYREGGRPQSLARLEVFSFRSARHPKNCDCGVPGLLGMSGSLLARVREPSALSAREADGNGGPLSLSLGGGRKEALVSFLLERTAVRRRRFKESRRPRGRVPPPGFFRFSIRSLFIFANFSIGRDQLASHASCVGGAGRATALKRKKKETTLGGGSLGSCVDEERSQLRELM